MDLVGKTFVMPLFNANLSTTTDFDLGNGIAVFNLPDTYEKELRSKSELIARYESSLPERFADGNVSVVSKQK